MYGLPSLNYNIQRFVPLAVNGIGFAMTITGICLAIIGNLGSSHLLLPAYITIGTGITIVFISYIVSKINRESKNTLIAQQPAQEKKSKDELNQQISEGVNRAIAEHNSKQSRDFEQFKQELEKKSKDELNQQISEGVKGAIAEHSSKQSRDFEQFKQELNKMLEDYRSVIDRFTEIINSQQEKLDAVLNADSELKLKNHKANSSEDSIALRDRIVDECKQSLNKANELMQSMSSINSEEKEINQNIEGKFQQLQSAISDLKHVVSMQDATNNISFANFREHCMNLVTETRKKVEDCQAYVKSILPENTNKLAPGKDISLSTNSLDGILIVRQMSMDTLKIVQDAILVSSNVFEKVLYSSLYINFDGKIFRVANSDIAETHIGIDPFFASQMGTQTVARVKSVTYIPEIDEITFDILANQFVSMDVARVIEVLPELFKNMAMNKDLAYPLGQSGVQLKVNHVQANGKEILFGTITNKTRINIDLNDRVINRDKLFEESSKITLKFVVTSDKEIPFLKESLINELNTLGNISSKEKIETNGLIFKLESAKYLDKDEVTLYKTKLNFAEVTIEITKAKGPQTLATVNQNIRQLRDSLKEHDIVGLDEKAIQAIQGSLIQFMATEEQLATVGLESNACAMVLHGPPGTGKTSIARLLYKVIQLDSMEYKYIPATEMLHSHVGETEASIRSLFTEAKKNPDKKYVIIIDEIESVFGTRKEENRNHENQPITELLTQLGNQTSAKNVLLIGITNYYDRLDKALVRQGRFNSIIYIGLPNDEQKKLIIERKLAKIRNKDNDIDIDRLVQETREFSAADIHGVIEGVKNKLLSMLNEDKDAKVNQKMLLIAIEQVKASK